MAIFHSYVKLPEGTVGYVYIIYENELYEL